MIDLIYERLVAIKGEDGDTYLKIEDHYNRGAINTKTLEIIDGDITDMDKLIGTND